MIIFESNGSGSEAVMLDKYGDVHEVIDNAYHPNPGSKEDGYPEIERCINWLVQHDLANMVSKDIQNWIKARTYATQEEYKYDDSEFDELVKDVMYSDDYKVDGTIIYLIKKYKKEVDDKYISNNKPVHLDACESLEKRSAEEIANYINEFFLRVRSGGKLNPEGTDTIYFRISSHGFDWHENIVNFLWDTFGTIEKMPSEIIICYDEETRGSDKVLYQGSPEDLFFYNDGKIFENKRFKNIKFE